LNFSACMLLSEPFTHVLIIIMQTSEVFQLV